MRTYTKKRRLAGFTLIEVMVVVAVIGILAAVAYPSYAEYIRNSRRAEAQSVLMDLATRQQQWLLDTRNYVKTTDACTTPILNVTVPPSVCGSYKIEVTIPDPVPVPPTFTATATPQGAQVKEKCGTLSVTHTGAKTPSKCW